MIKKKIPGHRRVTGEFKKLAKRHMKFMETAQMSPYFLWENKRYRVIVIHSILSMKSISSGPIGRLYIICDDQANNITDETIFRGIFFNELNLQELISRSPIIKMSTKLFHARDFGRQQQIFDEMMRNVEKDKALLSEKEVNALRAMTAFIEEKNNLMKSISLHAKQLRQIDKTLRREKPLEWKDANNQLHDTNKLRTNKRIDLSIRLLATSEERKIALNSLTKVQNLNFRKMRVVRRQLEGQVSSEKHWIQNIGKYTEQGDISSCISVLEKNTYENLIQVEYDLILNNLSLINKSVSGSSTK
ncbi:hypothetical protein D7Z54_23880 [Salibacterium salarium]|uniref:Uncharacterized protein n=1 Tax=Salibacterium salarium TaxID=284579 RepID=A0A428MXH4_9BACI|nr:hypothetical protein [Salibacterium salarium]RSL30835.1 hypothetical protein D7Z54_23880 [Salibacterium salarium]